MASKDVENDHFVYHVPNSVRKGSHQLDWNVVPGVGERLATPISASALAPPSAATPMIATLRGVLYTFHPTWSYTSLLPPACNNFAVATASVWEEVG